MKRIIAFSILIFTQATYGKAFRELVKLGLESSPQYSEVLYQDDYLKSQFRGATTNLILPGLDLSHQRSKNQEYGISDITDSRLTRLGLNYSLFSFGSDFNYYKETQHQYKAYKFESKQTLINQEQRIIDGLLDFIQTEMNVKIQKEIIELKEKSYEISQKKYNSGKISRTELLRVKMNLLNSQETLTTLNESSRELSNYLSALNINPKKIDLKFPWIDFFKTSGLKKALKVSEKSLRDSNPTILQYNELSTRYDASYKKEWRKHLGRFSIQYNRDLYQFDDQDDLYGWSASLVYTLPLFENFNQDYQVQLAKANKRSTEKYQSFYSEFLNDQAITKLDLLKMSYNNFNSRLDISKEIAEIKNNINRKYSRGQISINELFIEQDQLLQTQMTTNRVIYKLHKHYLEYLHLFGLNYSKNSDYFL